MNLKFELTQEEAQKVLDALVKQPYIEVVDVINKIQLQASKQMQNESVNNGFYVFNPDSDKAV